MLQDDLKCDVQSSSSNEDRHKKPHSDNPTCVASRTRPSLLMHPGHKPSIQVHPKHHQTEEALTLPETEFSPQKQVSPSRDFDYERRSIAALGDAIARYLSGKAD